MRKHISFEKNYICNYHNVEEKNEEEEENDQPGCAKGKTSSFPAEGFTLLNRVRQGTVPV